MDEVTTKTCVTRVGRFSFARVLVEIDAENGIKDKIEIMYKSKNVVEGTKRIVNVEYSWIPCICSHCKVFGHTDSYCKVKSKNVIDDGIVKANANEFKVTQNRKHGRKSFNMNRRTDMHNGKNGKMWNEGRHVNENNKWQQNSRFEYRRRREDGFMDQSWLPTDDSDGPNDIVFKVHYNGMFFFDPLGYYQGRVVEIDGCSKDSVMYTHLLNMLAAKIKVLMLKSLLKLHKGKGKMSEADIFTSKKQKPLQRGNGITIRENENPLPTDDSSDSEDYSQSESESDCFKKSFNYLSDCDDEVIELRKRRFEYKYTNQEDNDDTVLETDKGECTQSSKFEDVLTNDVVITPLVKEHERNMQYLLKNSESNLVELNPDSCFGFWHVIPCGGNLFEVRKGSKAFRVDESKRTCSCRMWQLSVICQQYCALSLRECLADLRRKGWASHEPKFSTTKISRAGAIMTCHNCWEKGHNKSTCKKDLIPVVSKEKGNPGRPKKQQNMETVPEDNEIPTFVHNPRDEIGASNSIGVFYYRRVNNKKRGTSCSNANQNIRGGKTKGGRVFPTQRLRRMAAWFGIDPANSDTIKNTQAANAPFPTNNTQAGNIPGRAEVLRKRDVELEEGINFCVFVCLSVRR
ncbi:pentatricopeptide repeat-containing protein [Tanacetum coccineum]